MALLDEYLASPMSPNWCTFPIPHLHSSDLTRVPEIPPLKIYLFKVNIVFILNPFKVSLSEDLFQKCLIHVYHYNAELIIMYKYIIIVGDLI